MIILIVLSVITLLGIVIHIYNTQNCEWYEASMIGSIIAVIFGTLLFIVLLILWLGRAADESNIEYYKAQKTTIEKMRSNGSSELERAALIQDIIKTNTHIARAKYWNEGIYDIFIVDEFANLEPLE